MKVSLTDSGDDTAMDDTAITLGLEVGDTLVLVPEMT